MDESAKDSSQLINVTWRVRERERNVTLALRRGSARKETSVLFWPWTADRGPSARFRLCSIRRYADYDHTEFRHQND
jgi:hypothetical protein